MTPIEAIRREDLDALRSALPVSAGPDVCGPLLLEAARAGWNQGISLLLNAKVEPDWKNECGETALMVAAKHAKADTVTLLLELGANSDLQDCHGYTASHFGRLKPFALRVPYTGWMVCGWLPRLWPTEALRLLRRHSSNQGARR